MSATQEVRDRVAYAFGHAVSSYSTDAYAGDSGDLAQEVVEELGFTPMTVELFWLIAEHVAGNYAYTGEADRIRHQIEAGEV